MPSPSTIEERERRKAEVDRLASEVSTIEVIKLAKWLAWSDRAMSITRSLSKFSAGADRYWESISPTHRSVWIAFAASLLGITAPREVRRGWGLDDPSDPSVEVSGG